MTNIRAPQPLDNRTAIAVSRVGPSHVKGLERLIGLNSNIRQGDPTEDIRLDFDLSCGIAPIKIGTTEFQLGLRTCFVELSLDNCDVHTGSRYEHWLEMGSIKSRSLQQATTSNSSNVGASLESTFDAPRGLAAVAAKLGLSRAWSKSSKNETSTEQSLRIELIVTSGQNRWRIGDLTRGDARRPDGILSGDYFREEKSSDGEALPLCRLKWLAADMPMSVTITATAALGSLLIFPTHTTTNTVAIEETKKMITKSSDKMQTDHNELLRAHVAGLVAARRLRNRQHSGDIISNEFAIGRLSLICEQTQTHPTSRQATDE